MGPIFFHSQFISLVYSDLERFFHVARPGYRYCIYFSKKCISFIDVKPLKFKDNIATGFENGKLLLKKKIWLSSGDVLS